MADEAEDEHREKDANPRIGRRHGVNDLRVCTMLQYQIIRAEVEVRKKEPSPEFRRGQKGQSKGPQPGQRVSRPPPDGEYQGSEDYRERYCPCDYGVEPGPDDHQFEDVNPPQISVAREQEGQPSQKGDAERKPEINKGKIKSPGVFDRMIGHALPMGAGHRGLGRILRFFLASVIVPERGVSWSSFGGS